MLVKIKRKCGRKKKKENENKDYLRKKLGVVDKKRKIGIYFVSSF